MRYVGGGIFVARFLWLTVWLAKLLGMVKVTVSEDTLQTLRLGNVMVMSNHPSLIETAVNWVVLDLLTKKHVWSITDEYLFNTKWYTSLRAIPVSRRKNTAARAVNVAAVRHQDAILQTGGIVVVYPEGTRTCKAVEHLFKGERRIGRCDVSLVKRAHKKGAALIPVWVEHGDCAKPQNLWTGYCKLLFGQTITITFGEPYHGEVIGELIAQAILSVKND